MAIETVLGLALALFCLREFRGIRLLRTVLIVPMVITPVVVAIVFRLIYASDAGMLTALSEAAGGGRSRSWAIPEQRFLGLVALDVWEWTPLMFLILLAGLQSLPGEPLRGGTSGRRGPVANAHRSHPADAAPGARHRHRARTIDAFGTFDQVFVLTRGGPERRPGSSRSAAMKRPSSSSRPATQPPCSQRWDCSSWH